MYLYSDRLKIPRAASSRQKRPHRSAATSPGDFAFHPCAENFSLDLATKFILQEAHRQPKIQKVGEFFSGKTKRLYLIKAEKKT